MKNVYIPHEEELSGAAELFDAALKQLPLEGCRLERHFLTDRSEFVAPPGHIFEMTGEFMVWAESNDGHHLMNPPIESAAIRARYKRERPDLEEDDEIRGWYEPPATFRGRSLTVSVNDVVYGGAFYPYQLRELRNAPPRIEVRVVGPTDADSWPRYDEFVWEDPPGSGMYSMESYPTTNHNIFWEFGEAVGTIGKMGIAQVLDDSSPAEIKIPRTRDQDDTYLWVPHGPRITREMMARTLNSAGHQVTEEQLTNTMRYERLKGFPLGDDPLRHLRIVLANTREVMPSLEELAEQVEEEKKANPRSSRDAMALLDKRREDHMREDRAKRLKGSLAVITESGSLDDLVRTHASPDWLEKELEKYIRDWTF